MYLVSIPFHDWKKCEREGFRTRDAHLLQEFEKNPKLDKLLVINRPISISEILLMRRNWRTKNGELIFAKNGVYVTQVSSKVTTLDVVLNEVVKPIQMRRHWIPYAVNQPKVVDAVQQALELLEIQDDYSLFISAPIYVPLVKHLRPNVFVLDAQDDLTKHAMYADMPNLNEYYEYCQEHADLIFSNAAQTAEWLGQKRNNGEHISNGVDIEKFNTVDLHQTPAKMDDIPRPIVGYSGKLSEIVDVKLFQELAQALPDVSFVFAGRMLDPDWDKPLRQFDNVYFLGDIPYKQLPQHLAAFDICTVAYSLGEQSWGDPIKLYEYLAMGKPIVSTNVGNVNAFREFPQVWISDTRAEFIENVKVALRMLEEDSIPQKELPERYYWKTKADYILQSIGKVEKAGA